METNNPQLYFKFERESDQKAVVAHLEAIMEEVDEDIYFDHYVRPQCAYIHTSLFSCIDITDLLADTGVIPSDRVHHYISEMVKHIGMIAELPNDELEDDWFFMLKNYEEPKKQGEIPDFLYHISIATTAQESFNAYIDFCKNYGLPYKNFWTGDTEYYGVIKGKPAAYDILPTKLKSIVFEYFSDIIDRFKECGIGPIPEKKDWIPNFIFNLAQSSMKEYADFCKAHGIPWSNMKLNGHNYHGFCDGKTLSFDTIPTTFAFLPLFGTYNNLQEYIKQKRFEHKNEELFNKGQLPYQRGYPSLPEELQDNFSVYIPDKELFKEYTNLCEEYGIPSYNPNSINIIIKHCYGVNDGTRYCTKNPWGTHMSFNTFKSKLTTHKNSKHDEKSNICGVPQQEQPGSGEGRIAILSRRQPLAVTSRLKRHQPANYAERARVVKGKIRKILQH